jgi:hypothetical protein
MTVVPREYRQALEREKEIASAARRVAGNAEARHA